MPKSNRKNDGKPENITSPGWSRYRRLFQKIAGTLRPWIQVAGLIFVISISGWVGWQLRAASPQPVLKPELPTIVEVQTMVGAVPDGKLGPETQAKWDRFICDQYAAGAR